MKFSRSRLNAYFLNIEASTDWPQWGDVLVDNRELMFGPA